MTRSRVLSCSLLPFWLLMRVLRPHPAMPLRWMMACPLLFVGLLAVLSAGRSADAVGMAGPVPISVPAGVASAEVAGAIRRALVGRRWIVAAQLSDHFDAALQLREQVARVRIDYGAREVDVARVDDAAQEADGQVDLRRRQAGPSDWLDDLVGDIRTNLQRRAAPCRSGATRAAC